MHAVIIIAISIMIIIFIAVRSFHLIEQFYYYYYDSGEPEAHTMGTPLVKCLSSCISYFVLCIRHFIVVEVLNNNSYAMHNNNNFFKFVTSDCYARSYNNNYYY